MRRVQTRRQLARAAPYSLNNLETRCACPGERSIATRSPTSSTNPCGATEPRLAMWRKSPPQHQAQPRERVRRQRQRHRALVQREARRSAPLCSRPDPKRQSRRSRQPRALRVPHGSPSPRAAAASTRDRLPVEVRGRRPCAPGCQVAARATAELPITVGLRGLEEKFAGGGSEPPTGPLAGTNRSQISAVLAEQDDRWQVVSFHNTLLQTPGPHP